MHTEKHLPEMIRVRMLEQERKDLIQLYADVFFQLSHFEDEHKDRKFDELCHWILDMM